MTDQIEHSSFSKASSAMVVAGRLVARLSGAKDHACNSVSCSVNVVLHSSTTLYVLRVVRDFLHKAWHSTCTHSIPIPIPSPCPMPHVQGSTSMFANSIEGATPVREPRSYLLRLYC